MDIGVTVTLDGSGSSDPEGETLTYMWSRLSGVAASFNDTTSATPTFTAANQVGEVVFQLIVTDAARTVLGLAKQCDHRGAHGARASDVGGGGIDQSQDGQVNLECVDERGHRV